MEITKLDAENDGSNNNEENIFAENYAGEENYQDNYQEYYNEADEENYAEYEEAYAETYDKFQDDDDEDDEENEDENYEEDYSEYQTYEDETFQDNGQEEAFDPQNSIRIPSFYDQFDKTITDLSFSFYDKDKFFYEPNAGQESIEIAVMRKKSDWAYTNQNLPFMKEIPFDSFLLLDLLSKVSYSTRGQFYRFLNAWKTFDPSFEFHFYHAMRTLTTRKLIQRLSKPIKFTRGFLQGGQVNAYYLTRKGRKLLLKFGIEADTFGEPEGVMFTRLQHEIMTAETAVDMMEKGDFIVRLKNETQLRSEMRKNGLHKSSDIKERTISDFAVEYFNKDYDRKLEHEIEIAVNYTAERIKRKPDYLVWVCYDTKEAEKIWHWKYEKAVILSNTLANEVRGKIQQSDEEAEKVSANTYPKLFELMSIFGGLTPDAVALLTGMRMNDVYQQLRNVKDYVKITTSPIPGVTKANNRSLYVWREFADSIIKIRQIFYVNLAFEYFLTKGHKWKVIDGKPVILGEKGTPFFFLADPRTHLPAAHFEPVKEQILRLLEEFKADNIQILVLVSNQEIASIYEYIKGINKVKTIENYIQNKKIRRPRTSRLKENKRSETNSNLTF